MMAAGYQSDRLEDVFQDEIIDAFQDSNEFKKFARSQYGLCLSESEIQHIIDDNERSVSDQKMGMLVKWKNKTGIQSTASRIRYIVEHYRMGNYSAADITLSGVSFVLFSRKQLGNHSSNVYLGEQRSEVTLPCQRAIKLVTYNEKNIRVAEILRKLGVHENLASMIHCGIYRDGPLKKFIYFVVELCHPKPLDDYLLERGEFEESFRRTIAEQLIRALIFIHGHDVIHCDINPKNILLSQDMKSIKLTAFDNSIIALGDTTIKQDISGCDTPGYYAPETYEKREFSRKSDIFSTGIVMSKVYSNNRHPFGTDQDAWIYNIKNNRKLDLSHLLVKDKTQAADLLQKMLQLKPSERPTAKEVQRLLEDQHLTTIPQKVLNKDLRLRDHRVQPNHWDTDDNQSSTNTRHCSKANGIIVLDRIDNNLYSYKPSTSEWNQIQKNHLKKFTIVALRDHIYALEGKSVSRLRYNDLTSKWDKVADMKENRGSYPPAVALEEKNFIYVCGSCKCSKSVEQYDVELNQWMMAKDMNFARDLSCLVAVTGHIYCIGGLDSDGK